MRKQIYTFSKNGYRKLFCNNCTQNTFLHIRMQEICAQHADETVCFTASLQQFVTTNRRKNAKAYCKRRRNLIYLKLAKTAVTQVWRSKGEQHMKKSKKVLIILGSIVLAIVVVFGVCTIFAHSQNDRSQPTESLSNWMSFIKDETLLKKLAIPGAHDAGTAGISYLAETQDKDTATLLACGTRYFDLRVSKQGDELKIYHGPFVGVKLNDVLNACKQFLTTRTSEMLILDFQHFENDAQAATLEMFCNVFDNDSLVVCNNSNESDEKFIDTLTLGQCRGKALVVWGRDTSKFDNNFVFQRNNDEGTRENSVLHSYYYSELNKKSSKAYIETALPTYIDLYKQQGNGLFVLQGQLTDGLFVFGPRFREASHNKNMNAYVQSLNNGGDLDIINIVMRDFVSARKNCLTIQLNQAKGNVKEAAKTAFEQMIAENS